MAPEAKKEKKDAEAPPPARSGHGGWLPVIAIIVLVPVLSFAMAQFVLYPGLEKRLERQFGAAAGASDADSHGAAAHGKEPAAPAGEPTYSYEFKDIVSNLGGSMKSRFIKVSFTAYSADPEVEKIVELNKAKLLDATLGVLSTVTVADIEDPTVKNKIRAELITAFHSVLRARVIEEIYFSEFVIQ